MYGSFYLNLDSLPCFEEKKGSNFVFLTNFRFRSFQGEEEEDEDEDDEDDEDEGDEDDDDGKFPAFYFEF